MSDSDIVQDFLVESDENLDRLDRDLVGLEKNPHDKDALAGVFRTIHTIKGTCGFLGFNKLEKVAHVGENLLTRMRDGQLILNPEITTALLGMVDAVRQMLKEIESTGQDGEADYPELRETLTRLQNPAAASVALTPPSPAALDAKPLPTQRHPVCAREGDSLPAPPKRHCRHSCARGRASEKKDDSPRKPSRGKDRRPAGRAWAVQASDIARALEAAGTRRSPASGRNSCGLGIGQAGRRLAAQQISGRQTAGHCAGDHSRGRQPAGQADDAGRRTGAGPQPTPAIRKRLEDTGLQAVSQRMNLIATELQEDVMKTRMQPIGNIWGQFPRTVRDVALGCGKEVAIEMEGKETELDKTIIEAIKDPLTHLVRNSVDHGIELPEERVKAGKDRTGRLILRAFHEGGQVNIEISDDGAGLNGDRIRKKAVERGVITAEQAARMPEREIFNLIFLPGFSTAEKVTNVSGRGVGMDVVKTNVEKIGGTVDVQSTRAGARRCE